MGKYSAKLDWCVISVLFDLCLTDVRQAKAAGLKNLAQVQELTGQSGQTLTNWCRDKPKLFKVVLAGCVAINKLALANNDG